MDLAEATKTIGETIRPHMGMLLFLRGNAAEPSDVTNNGTISFVDTGSAQLLVTCAHVITAFREKREGEPSFTMAVSGSSHGVLQIREEWLVDYGNAKLDLAIFRLPDPTRLALIGKSYFRAGNWPPSKPTVSDTAAIVGFPGEHRRAVPGGLQANINVVCVDVSSVSERYITLIDLEQSRRVVKLNAELGEVGTLAGMSGSAAYTFDDLGKPHLVGYLFEAGEDGGAHVPIRIVHASFIRADGTLDWSAASW